MYILSRVARWYIYFQTKNPSLGIFWRALEIDSVGLFNGHSDYFTTIWFVL
jgi:hypothetical protein